MKSTTPFTVPVEETLAPVPVAVHKYPVELAVAATE